MKDARFRFNLLIFQNPAEKSKFINNLFSRFNQDYFKIIKVGFGWISRGSINPRFSKVVFNLKPGEISQPFESMSGLHVVKLLE